ncbi:MerR family transcriptional regulator [Saccharopolyspora flava]|uniref:DNA-binding transcriptional regulator, MerR family n=1 Tax=Saccharopolyspora flava TaxID=95161 RepID=A0A1I6PPC4_9PSEU|nr:MerR family transcriptional regulator [Saccharopolyspora flava]SFS41970.1 DNA-binding transcriptional regulator, MerR family [Saccharopolyspora flava]
MAWSTREIAELAGTSLRAVRHYHEVGLLDEPERRANGYKQYGVAHLVRLLRIKRLVDLGFSLSQIAAMGDADTHPEEALRALDAELAATIERLQRARVELGLLLHQSVPTDLPPELGALADGAEMSEADRSFLVVMSRVIGPDALEAYAEMLRSAGKEATVPEFDHLAADADETTRAEVAERLAGLTTELYRKHPGLLHLNSDAPRGPRHARETAGKALADLYNPAQLDVLRRVHDLVNSTPPRSGDG